MEVPEVRYARSGDVHIAYQVLGEGPDLVFTPAGFGHLMLRWELPANARMLRRMAGFSRLISWDKRGMGMSDRHGGVPTLDEQLEDLRAVLDAAGSERATLFGLADGAALAALFAATYPDRVSAAILYGMVPRFAPGADGLGVSQAFIDAMAAGVDAMFDVMAPSKADDAETREWWRRSAMMSASPGTVEQMLARFMQLDLRAVLPTIGVPVTILQRTADRVIHPANLREAARLIPGARCVELQGDFATWAGDVDALVDEIEEVVTGERRRAAVDRMLATILFTDIVGSTTTAAELGDTAWGAVLDEHDAFVRRRIAVRGGRLVKSLGDGAMAIFESPGRAVQCAAEIVEGLEARHIQIRAGVHTGECERRGDDVGGIAVHIASRVGALAEPGEVLVTGTVRDLVFGSDLVFDERGAHELRGVPGSWPLLALRR
jgi:class 3 adenylate cyclase